MPKVVSITREHIEALQAEGLSLPKIADRSKVSLSTIKRIISRKESNREVVEFTNRLAALVGEAPNAGAKLEVNRAINRMRRADLQDRI